MSGIDHDILVLLEEGNPVFSLALGRLGEIVNVRENDSFLGVELCPPSRSFAPSKRHRHIHAATSFDVGDKVQLKKVDGYWTVVNTFEELAPDYVPKAKTKNMKSEF